MIIVGRHPINTQLYAFLDFPSVHGVSRWGGPHGIDVYMKDYVKKNPEVPK